jgi:hypothetical protein
MAEPTTGQNPGETPAGDPAAAPREDGLPTGIPFEPGNQVAKLGGRPKGLARRVREEAGDDGDLLVSLMLHHATGWRFMVNPAITITPEMREDPNNWEKVSVSDQQAAVRWLADRGYGKAQEFVPIEADTLQLGADFAALAAAVERDMDELEARRRKRAEEAAQTG